ncbi:MAG TPA: sugar-binding domain-containing protein, partial [Blastocatellia bacterium]
MMKLIALFLSILCLSVAASAQARKWAVRVEEPTGIERRVGEVAQLTASFATAEARVEWLRVIDPRNRETPLQIAVKESHPDGSIKRAEILFPVTMVPGERPVYTLLSSPLVKQLKTDERGGEYKTDIYARPIGTSRFEIGNSRFGIIINLGRDNTTPAIVEAYNRTSGEHRMLNLVETTPDLSEPLAFGIRSAGWGTAMEGAARTSGFTRVEIIESGPLRARVRMTGARAGTNDEEWEFEWEANSPVLLWRARTSAKEGNYGFFFSAVSASPYEPFTHWATGAEIGWPDGWETDNPPHKKISSEDFLNQTMDDLPGSFALYYNPKENYGALELVELDRALRWTGIGSRQFYAVKKAGARAEQKPQTDTAAIVRRSIIEDASGWSAQIAIAFPEWKGTETLLDARSVHRRFAQPMLARISGAQIAKLPAFKPAPRAAFYKIKEEPVRSNRSSGETIELSLDGDWKIQHAEKGEGEPSGLFKTEMDDSAWQTVRVPGSVHTQILKYPDYFTRKAEWISFREWWYRKTFRAPASLKGQRVRLQFEATDYYADIWLNGKELGHHEGYIDAYEFDVTDKINFDGENLLAVRVWTPVHYYWRHRPYTIKGSYGGVDQKPDNITALGITRSVRLVGSGQVLIDSVTARPSLNADGSASVDVEVTLDAEKLEGQLELELSPRNFKGETRLVATVELARATDKKINVRFHLDKPELWWTWDHGKPNLYTLAARVIVGGRLSDQREQALGIREIEKVDWVFYINGKRMFIRGTNSYYLELFLSEMTRAKYERDLKLMRDMNINMIRLHCHFQNREFYDLCDEMGILVWQDFLEAWYPHDSQFALRAAALYDPLIKLTRNHPSVALWATSDEEDLENYRVLTKHLAPRVYANDPEHRAVVRSTGRYGDGHIYEGWYGGTIWAYTRTEEKFISELGATALPDYESLIQFLPDHWPIETHKEDWIFHKLQIPEAMRAWGRPDGKTLREYIPQTQMYVARLHQLAIERMRRRKYDAGGVL